jgi:hypothetical protein
MFFAIVGFLFLLAITFGPAVYILWQGYWMSKFGAPYPIGALVAAGIFAGLGFLVIYNAPFHISIGAPRP